MSEPTVLNIIILIVVSFSFTLGCLVADYVLKGCKQIVDKLAKMEDLLEDFANAVYENDEDTVIKNEKKNQS